MAKIGTPLTTAMGSGLGGADGGHDPRWTWLFGMLDLVADPAALARRLRELHDAEAAAKAAAAELNLGKDIPRLRGEAESDRAAAAEALAKAKDDAELTSQAAVEAARNVRERLDAERETLKQDRAGLKARIATVAAREAAVAKAEPRLRDKEADLDEKLAGAAEAKAHYEKLKAEAEAVFKRGT